jgi:hypothetical protein
MLRVVEIEDPVLGPAVGIADQVELVSEQRVE